MQEEVGIIYGKHTVKEALLARPDAVRSVYLEEGDSGELGQLCAKNNILRLRKMPAGVPHDAVHQGAVAEIMFSKLVVEYEDFIRTCTVTPDTAFALLGEVQDPQNVGAIIRSASAFGVSAVLVPEHRQVQINATVVKVSAGMVFRIPMVRIGNVNQTITDLKDRGFWIYGLDGSATQSVSDEQFEKPSIFVVGNEATGIREKTLEHCDIPLRIPMHNRTESLNASVSAAVVFYAWSVQHPQAL